MKIEFLQVTRTQTIIMIMKKVKRKVLQVSVDTQYHEITIVNKPWQCQYCIRKRIKNGSIGMERKSLPFTRIKPTGMETEPN